MQIKDGVQPDSNRWSLSRMVWNFARGVTSIVFMIVALSVVGLSFGTDETNSRPELMLVFTLAAYFPFTYLAYWAVRTEMRRKRLEEELGLLGYPKEEATNLYNQVHDQVSYFLFITLSVLTTIIGAALLFWSPPETVIAAGTVQAIRYGFFGSYLFSAFLVYRRFSTNDLHPTVYLYCAFTIIAGLVFNYVAMEALTSITSAQGEATGVGGGLLAIIAFALGYFPYLAVRWFNRLAFTSLGVNQRRTDVLPLSLIDGISEWHETRLRDTGIDDIQNLASAEIRELLVNTAFNVQEIIEWIDQATLYLYLEPSEIESFRRAKIRMTSDFCGVWESCLTDDAKRAELVLNLQSTEERLKILYSSIIEGPNVHRVRNYWRRAQSRVDEILNIKAFAAQLGNLANMTVRFDGLPMNLAHDNQMQLMSEYGALLNRLLPNPSNDDILNFGKLYLSLQEYDKAIKHFDEVITKIKQPTITDELHFGAYHGRIFANAYNARMSDALTDCDTLIAKTAQNQHDHIVAYLIKGYICDHFKQYDQLIQTLEKAIEIDPQHAECRNRLAWHYATNEPHTSEKLTKALQFATDAVQLAQNNEDYPGCVDTLAYAQIMYADIIETTAEAKAKLYNTAIQELQEVLKSPYIIPDYGYAAINERLQHIAEYWRTVQTPQGIENEADALLTQLTIPTQDPMTLADIKTRLKQLRAYGATNIAENGALAKEAPITVTTSTTTPLEIATEVAQTPEEPTVPSNPTIPQ